MAILTAIDENPGDALEVTARLAALYDFETEDGAAAAEIVAARLAELASLGLIDPA